RQNLAADVPRLACAACRHIGGAADPRHLAFGQSRTRPKSWAPSTSAYRHCFGERRQVHHLLVPGGELGMARPPRLVGVAEVEIAQRAADGDLTDRVQVAERGRLLLELDDGARHLALLERNVGLAALVLRQGELTPAGLRRIEDAVGQRLLRQRHPARRTRRREEFWRRTDRIEVFADYRAV